MAPHKGTKDRASSLQHHRPLAEAGGGRKLMRFRYFGEALRLFQIKHLGEAVARYMVGTEAASEPRTQYLDLVLYFNSQIDTQRWWTLYAIFHHQLCSRGKLSKYTGLANGGIAGHFEY